MIVGVCRIALHLPAAASLKDKRQALRRLIDRTRQKFSVAIAETGDNDLWQRAEVGIATVGNDRQHIESVLRNVVLFVDSLYLGEILDRQIDLIPFGED